MYLRILMRFFNSYYCNKFTTYQKWKKNRHISLKKTIKRIFRNSIIKKMIHVKKYMYLIRVADVWDTLFKNVREYHIMTQNLRLMYSDSHNLNKFLIYKTIILIFERFFKNFKKNETVQWAYI